MCETLELEKNPSRSAAKAWKEAQALLRVESEWIPDRPDWSWLYGHREVGARRLNVYSA